MKNEENNNTHNNTEFGDHASREKSGAATQIAREADPAKNENFDGVGTSIKDPAQGLLDKAKDTAGQAYEMATERAASKLEEQKATLTSGLATVAGSIRQVGESLRQSDEQTVVTEMTASYGERLAGHVEKLSGYFEQKDLRAVAGDVEDFARRNPALFIGGAFALGIVAARFLKSAKPPMTAGAGAAVKTAKKLAAGAAGNASETAGSAEGQNEGDNIVNFDKDLQIKNSTAAKDTGGSLK